MSGDGDGHHGHHGHTPVRYSRSGYRKYSQGVDRGVKAVHRWNKNKEIDQEKRKQFDRQIKVRLRQLNNQLFRSQYCTEK